MRKLLQLLGLFLVIIASVACEGPEGLPGRDGFDGPQGPAGRDGQDGRDGNILARIYEIDLVNFNEDNNFRINFEFPEALFESDVVFVYRLEAAVDGKAIWEPLPTATIYFDDNDDGIDDGFLQYRFNFTFDDVEILIESDDALALNSDFVDNQVFRIVIVPGAFGNTKNAKNKSLEELMTLYKIEEYDVVKAPL